LAGNLVTLFAVHIVVNPVCLVIVFARVIRSR
jgi:hypothetical protein